MGIPSGITRSDVLSAAVELRAGLPSEYGEPQKYEVIVDGECFPPKAIVGLAARRLIGRPLRPDEFSGGRSAGQANAILQKLGFEIVGVQRDPATWLFLQGARMHAGNRGYPDILGELYVYDDDVQYRKQVREGDTALVHDGDHLLGLGRIGLIDHFPDTRSGVDVPIAARRTSCPGSLARDSAARDARASPTTPCRKK